MKQKKLWKKITLIFTFSFLVIGGVFTYVWLDCDCELQKPTVWQAYSPSNSRFDIQFPSDPKESSQEMTIADKTIEYHELSTNDKDSIYSVSYIDFPGHWKLLGCKKLLTKSFHMLLQNESNVQELVKQEHTTYQGNSVLEYHLKQGGKEVKGRFIIVGNTLYRISVNYPLAAVETAQPEAFFNSFQVKG